MQTFMPHANIYASVKALDNKRLGKQRVEAMQTYNQITKGKGGYPYHPVNKMWIGYEDALAKYHNACINEWVNRGFVNNMSYIPTKKNRYIDMPSWLGYDKVHRSHRDNLLRKDYDYYSKLFPVNKGKDYYLNNNTPYFWPTSSERYEYNESYLSDRNRQID